MLRPIFLELNISPCPLAAMLGVIDDPLAYFLSSITTPTLD